LARQSRATRPKPARMRRARPQGSKTSEVGIPASRKRARRKVRSSVGEDGAEKVSEGRRFHDAAEKVAIGATAQGREKTASFPDGGAVGRKGLEKG